MKCILYDLNIFNTSIHLSIISPRASDECSKDSSSYTSQSCAPRYFFLNLLSQILYENFFFT